MVIVPLILGNVMTQVNKLNIRVLFFLICAYKICFLIHFSSSLMCALHIPYLLCKYMLNKCVV